MSRVGAGIAAAALLGGCAAKVPQELERARDAQVQARGSLADELVPAEVHKAGEALAEAEAAFDKDPRDFHTVSLAYVAHRSFQLADALADAKAQASLAAASDAQYQSDQDAVMRVARADLATTQTRLEASEDARDRAEAQMRDAMAELAKLAAVKEEPRGVVITLSGGVLFASGQATLLPAAQARLGEMTQALRAAGDRTILIEGHTDSVGSESFNLDLSQRRADTVRNFMATNGYDVRNTRAVGIGEARPIASNDTETGRANNRRVEVIIEPEQTASK